MAKRFGMVSALLALVSFAAGCNLPAEKAAPPSAPQAQPESAAPAAQVQQAQEFNVALWDGRTLQGPITWTGDSIAVDGVQVARGDIRFIQSATKGSDTPAAVDMTQLGDGFAPLDDAALAEYRKRADAAAEKYKGSNSVLCLDRGEDTLERDGKQVYRYHALVLILKDAGRGVANLSLGFSEGKSASRILYARSVSPDGVSQWAEPGTFTVSVPPQDARFVDTRTRVISGQVPGAEVGALVEYAYEYIVYNPEIDDFFFPGFTFQADSPVLDSIFEARVPEGRPLNYTTRNMPEAVAKPVISQRDGYDIYRWEYDDAPVITAEASMPDMSDVAASVQASLYSDWTTFMEPTARFQKERIAVTPAIQETADRITAGASTDDEKVAAIYHWVQRNINYLSVKASLSSGWAGHPAEETLRAGYGDCTDVSNLTASLCRAVGVDAYPVIIKTNDAGTAVTEIPIPDANHAITLVYPNGRPRFIDTTAEDFRYPYFRADDHGIKAIVYMKSEIMDIPVPAPEDNMRESRQEITLNADGSADIVERNRYTGTYEAGVRGYWRSQPPEMRSLVMQQSLQGRSPGARIRAFDLGALEDLAKQLAMTIDYSVPALGTRIKDLYIFSLPNFRQTFPETALQTRMYDIETSTTLMYETSVTVRLPEGYTLTGTPEPLVLHGTHLWFEGSVTPSADGRTLAAKQIFKRLARVVPVTDYQQYRKEASAIAAWTDLKLVLKEDKAESAAGASKAAPQAPAAEMDSTAVEVQ